MRDALMVMIVYWTRTLSSGTHGLSYLSSMIYFHVSLSNLFEAVAYRYFTLYVQAPYPYGRIGNSPDGSSAFDLHNTRPREMYTSSVSENSQAKRAEDPAEKAGRWSRAPRRAAGERRRACSEATVHCELGHGDWRGPCWSRPVPFYSVAVLRSEMSTVLKLIDQWDVCISYHTHTHG